jgi:hypothetical protein
MTNRDETQGFRLPKGSAAQLQAYIRQLLFVLGALFFSLFQPAKAQSPVEYSVYANIIYHFTKYIDWPDSEKRGDFVIGVVGNTPLFDELKAAIATKTAGSQHIIVKKLTASMPSYDCQILFLSEGESWSLEKIAQRTEGAPVLLISEDKDAASRGACINFSIVSERLKLEINKNNIENRRLRIANELLRLGKIVK